MAKRLSKVADTSGGGLRCPRCGGSAFKSKRSLLGKIGLGLLARKSRVQCQTCGKTFKRG